MANISLELPMTHVRRAAAFYEAVFGWSMQHLPEVDYTLMTEGDGPGEHYRWG